jgi:hypothetical protein
MWILVWNSVEIQFSLYGNMETFQLYKIPFQYYGYGLYLLVMQIWFP